MVVWTPAARNAVGGTPEVVQDGVSGILVVPGDSAALARSLSVILRNEEKRHKMGKEGKKNGCSF
jgi:glycosyltransferase involved in cell wall biosynthesis